VATENQNFVVNGVQLVRYGAGTSWITKLLTGTVSCSTQTFGSDPTPGVVKMCQAPDGTATSPPSSGPVPGSVLGLPTFTATSVRVAPNTNAAALGDPSTKTFNGLGLFADTLHHMPGHAIPAIWAEFPTPLANTGTPSISDVAVLNRRDALIVYVPAVKGAADYRAYIYNPAKVTFSGTQPRGAVIACAGYRQRYKRNVDSLLSNQDVATKHRELLQAIEVPGLVADGNYKIIVEALASPCPFPGMMGHTSAELSLGSSGTFQIRGFKDVMTAYGNEILNGQGSTLNDFKVSKSDGTTPNEPIGKPVPPKDANVPADPVVIARSALTVVRPALDEAANGPVFDVGSNAVFDDFSTDAVMTTFKKSSRGEGAGLTSDGQFGDWFFWMMGVQPALPAAGSTESGDNPKGVQVWQRHGRLYTTFGDWGQDILGSVYFASTKSAPQELDATKYTHSIFRVNSGATGRRYWHWIMCGGATRDELVDPVTHIPRIRPVGSPHFNQRPDALNPSGPMTGAESADPKFPVKECLNILQDGDPRQRTKPGTAANTWFDEPHTELMAFINPPNTVNGFINLKPAGVNDGDDNVDGGMAWRMNAQRQPTQPMFEPFDQEAPLTHYDVFVRPDRVIFYINGRQAWCGDLSDAPLKMKYGLIAYGNVLYHSGAEVGESYLGGRGGTTHYLMNTPWADTRAWDVVGHSEKIDIPTQFKFDPATCFKPNSMAVR